jgi:predicted nucleic acid-binding protein
MSRFFADTFYWIALSNRRDQWHARVQTFNRTLRTYHLHTTDEVMAEFLTFYGEGSPHTRRQAARFARNILADPRVTVIPQTHASFLAGLALYEARLDKHYSMTDCISMHVMRREELTEVLSNDHHFTQEGFRILFP